MKYKIPGALLALLVLFTISTRADTLVWTNTSGGDWYSSTNWVPPQVPVAGDDVVITNSGTYTITNVVNVVLNSLILGGTNGIQTLNASTLTLTNASIVKSNGVLNWGGGDLEGSLTVNPGATLSISNSVFLVQNNYYYNFTNTASLTNYGTVIWAGMVYAAGSSLNNSGGGIIYNAGLWQSVADGQISTYNTYGTNTFINVGTLEKTGGREHPSSTGTSPAPGSSILSPVPSASFGAAPTHCMEMRHWRPDRSPVPCWSQATPFST